MIGAFDSYLFCTKGFELRSLRYEWTFQTMATEITVVSINCDSNAKFVPLFVTKRFDDLLVLRKTKNQEMQSSQKNTTGHLCKFLALNLLNENNIKSNGHSNEWGT